MAVSRLCPLALAFSVAIAIAVSTVYTFINGYSEDMVFKFKRNGEPSQSSLSKDVTFPHQKIRLPNDVRPLSYDIYIHPNLTTFKFSGWVKIVLRCYKPTKDIVLHSRDLCVGDVKLTNSKQKRLEIARTVQHKKNQQYLIAMDEELRQKETYALYMEFNGTLSNSLEGFYRSSYRTKSKQVRWGL